MYADIKFAKLYLYLQNSHNEQIKKQLHPTQNLELNTS